MDVAATPIDYHTRVVDDPRAIDAGRWNALLARQPSPTPFMRHEVLAALHASASAVPRSGWAPRYLLLESDRGLHAAAALYLKSHSYGEYVFDWSWAEAHRRHGLAYYPKLLGAVPFTPVPGTRLLADSSAARRALVQAIGRFADDLALSSAHLLFVDDTDAAALAGAGWMLRHGVQFHWQQDMSAPAADFGAFLARLQRDKRRKIAQERRRVAEQDITFSVHEGAAITPALWDFFHHCYRLTYEAHGSTPYLSRDFFARVAATMPGHWVLFLAERAGAAVGCSLVALDPERRVAYGRYWGATAPLPCLHFEACYYQPLQWCIAHGYMRFEGGAQGEHKMARGLLPVRTTSAHRLRDARFARAVADFLGEEGRAVDEYVDELRERNPFRPAAGGAPG